MPSSRGSSWCRDQTRVSCLLHWQVGSLPLAPPSKPLWGFSTNIQLFMLDHFPLYHRLFYFHHQLLCLSTLLWYFIIFWNYFIWLFVHMFIIHSTLSTKTKSKLCEISGLHSSASLGNRLWSSEICLQRIYWEVPFGASTVIKKSKIWHRESLKYRIVDTMQLGLPSNMSQVKGREELPICIDQWLDEGCFQKT